MASWVEFSERQQVIFDVEDPEEVRLRNPMAFAASLKIPLILFAERGGMDEVNAQFETRAKRAGKSCELFIVSGDHQSMVEPSVKQSID